MRLLYKFFDLNLKEKCPKMFAPFETFTFEYSVCFFGCSQIS